MSAHIQGLHHVTSMASSARGTDAFFTGVLGLRRVKKTVNFDAPDVYHLYYGDAVGTPGSVMTYFPFPDIGPRRRGSGEVGATLFAVPPGALDWWRARLTAAGVQGIAPGERFGAAVLAFEGPDGDEFELVETPDDAPTPWTGGDVPQDVAIRGFRGASLRLRDGAATGNVLRLMGYAAAATSGSATRFVRAGGNGADVIDVEVAPDLAPAAQGAGSVHHIAFAVADRDAQAAVRAELAAAGQHVTPSIDRDYFWAIYFRTPGGVLFEVATGEPGFERDEDAASLGTGLRLPAQHAHLRARLEQTLEPLG